MSDFIKEPAGSDIPALTGARGPAAVWVVMFHVAMDPLSTEGYPYSGAEYIWERGSLAVDFFFVLSGFILHHVYQHRFKSGVNFEGWFRFVRLRFARIWPVHIVTLIGALTLYVLAAAFFSRTPADDSGYTLGSLVHNVLMTHAWFGYTSANVPSWSISAEWAAYLVFPLLCFLAQKIQVIIIYCSMVISLMGLAMLSSFYGELIPPLLRVAAEFWVGVSLCELWRREAVPQKIIPGWACVVLVVLGCRILPAVAIPVFVIIFCLAILALTDRNDLLAKILSLGPFIFLGEISFSLYMVHSDVWSAVKNAGRVLFPTSNPVHPVTVAVGVVMSIIGAFLLYRLVEVPCRNLLRGSDPKAAGKNALKPF